MRVGEVMLGGGAPVVVQSMTNTDTADVDATVRQVIELAEAGSEIVRVTVNTDEAAKAVPQIRERLCVRGCNVPLVGDFHYHGHLFLTRHPDCAEALAKLRINPGNVGFGAKRDKQFEMMIEVALRHDRPVRIGVNWGSLDQALSTRMMDDNARLPEPKSADEVLREALVVSALASARRAEEIGLAADRIVISAKVSRVQDLVAVYRELARRSRYALHLGLTEAGLGAKGIVATTAALAVLLQDGIGDTIRASLTPRPGEARTQEVIVCQELLQSLGLRRSRRRSPPARAAAAPPAPTSRSWPTGSRTICATRCRSGSSAIPGVEALNVAVMGCIVNGPGESKHADIGISLPGTGESPAAPVFIDGKKAMTLRGARIAEEFQALVEDYVERRFGGERKSA